MPSRDGKIRCLALSGGGIRGIIPARILQFIEEKTGKRIFELFDMIGGTSTGGILAAALTKPLPLTANDCLNLYLQRGKDIFAASTWRRIWTLGKNVGPRYDGSGLDKVLAETFGGSVLESALTPTFVTAYSLSTRRPLFFKSWVPTSPLSRLADVCRATSAGPTYFPPAIVGGQYYVDGGVVDNNPSLSCVIEAAMKYGCHVRDIEILSLGTGFNETAINGSQATGWGNLQWVQPLIDVIMDGVPDLTHYQMCDLMPSEQYHYLQTRLPPENSDMDNVKTENLAYLVATAQTLVDSNSGALLALCERLKG